MFNKLNIIIKSIFYSTINNEIRFNEVIKIPEKVKEYSKYIDSKIFMDDTLEKNKKIELGINNKELYKRLDTFFITVKLLYNLDLHIHESWPGELNWTDISICAGRERSKDFWASDIVFEIYNHESIQLNYDGPYMYYIYYPISGKKVECKNADDVYAYIQGLSYEQLIKPIGYTYLKEHNII